MAYTARLLNRLAQCGQVSYDLVIEDDAGTMSPVRSSVGLPLRMDTTEQRGTLLAKCVQDATDAYNNPPPPPPDPIAVQVVQPLAGSGQPAERMGDEGSTYLDVVSGDVYLKQNGTWR